EHVRKPGEAQDRSDDQNDHKSRKRVGDERREKDTASHQFTKGMSHEPFSVGALAACAGAASITAPARRRAALASIARHSSPGAASGKLRAMARMRCASRSRATAIGAAIRPIVVNSRGLGVVAPNPMTRATTESETLVADQPAKTKRADAIAN